MNKYEQATNESRGSGVLPPWLCREIESQREYLLIVHSFYPQCIPVSNAEICARLYYLNKYCLIRREDMIIFKYIIVLLMLGQGLPVKDTAMRQYNQGLNYQQMQRLEYWRSLIYRS